jgi:hypothetical protein
VSSQEQAPPISSWQTAIVGLCGVWFDYAPAELVLEQLPEAVARQIGTRVPQSADALVSFARRRLSAFPFQRVDPSWLEDVFPRDPLLQEWLAGYLPQTHHCALRSTDPNLWSLSAEAPAWFPLWVEKTLQDRLRYPVAVPGEIDPRAPVTQLALLSGSDARALLQVYGLRLVAAALFRSQRHEIVDSLYGLPQAMADRVVALVRERQFPLTQDWSGALSHLRDKTAAEEVPLRLAALDVGVHCRHHGKAALARRVALRLPRSLGEEILASYAGERMSDIGEVSEPEWHVAMRRDMKDMVAQGYLQPPRLEEEVHS